MLLRNRVQKIRAFVSHEKCDSFGQIVCPDGSQPSGISPLRIIVALDFRAVKGGDHVRRCASVCVFNLTQSLIQLNNCAAKKHPAMA